MGANEMVIGHLEGQMRLEFVFVFGKRKGLPLQRCVLPAQGQIESLYQTGVDIFFSDLSVITVNDAFGHGNHPASLSLFYNLGIAEIWVGLFLRRSRTASLTGRGMGNDYMIAVKQGDPISIQPITYEQRKLSTKHVCRSLDESIRTALGTCSHNDSQDDAVF